MTKPKYVYREGARVGGVPAEVAGRELARIARAGKVTARAVVDDATADNSPLHPAFPWDDAIAADQHRLDIARRLIRAVQVVGIDAKPRSVYVHVSSEGAEGDYRLLSTVLTQPDAFILALAEAQRRLRSAQDAIDELRVAAEATRPADFVARISLAAQALSTAEKAVLALS